MRAMTEQVYVDEIEMDDEGIAEMLDENAVAQISRPGTSLKTANSAQNSLSMAMRYLSRHLLFLLLNHVISFNLKTNITEWSSAEWLCKTRHTVR